MSGNFDDKYLKRGASASKSEVHDAIKNTDKGLFPGAFCKIVEDYLGNDEEFCNIMHADGAGTKSILAYLYYKETGDMSVFRGIAQDSLIMNIDDIFAVGAVDNFLLSNTIGRNKHLISGEIIGEIVQGYEDVINMLKKYDINVKSCGGETADLGDIVRTLVVDATITARMKRKDVIDCDNIKPGDVIVGLSSFGKAVYEKEYNAGMGSNGLTSARHDVFNKIYANKYPESYDNNTDENYIYCGEFKLTDPFGVDDLTIGKAVLSPTRTFAPVLREIILAKRDKISGIIHNSGGGQVKCRSFGKGLNYVKNNMFPVPPLFSMIKKASGTSLAEMYQVFNMGSRMDIILPEKYANKVIEISKSYNIDAEIVGHVEKNSESDTKNKVTITGADGEIYTY
jgi:phosphoribosylformylglycinamidine cyclo-ligase